MAAVIRYPADLSPRHDISRHISHSITSAKKRLRGNRAAELRGKADLDPGPHHHASCSRQVDNFSYLKICEVNILNTGFPIILLESWSQVAILYRDF